MHIEIHVLWTFLDQTAELDFGQNLPIYFDGHMLHPFVVSDLYGHILYLCCVHSVSDLDFYMFHLFVVSGLRGQQQAQLNWNVFEWHVLMAQICKHIERETSVKESVHQQYLFYMCGPGVTLTYIAFQVSIFHSFCEIKDSAEYTKRFYNVQRCYICICFVYSAESLILQNECKINTWKAIYVSVTRGPPI